MSGHSKWATTKRHKAAIDAKRGKIFSMLSKELTLAARDGGGDPSYNAKLRMVINKAKEANMPADNVTRAIKKGTGELEGQTIEELTYEGYAPGSVGVIVEVTTDNKNRSASEVRNVFTKAGGSLAGAGAVMFGFQHKGQFLIASETIAEDKLMELALEVGADDVKNNGDHYEVLCALTDFDSVVQMLEKNNVKTETAELAYIPTVTVPVDDPETVKKIEALIEKLEDLEDVKNVYANYAS